MIWLVQPTSLQWNLCMLNLMKHWMSSAQGWVSSKTPWWCDWCMTSDAQCASSSSLSTFCAVWKLVLNMCDVWHGKRSPTDCIQEDIFWLWWICHKCTLSWSRDHRRSQQICDSAPELFRFVSNSKVDGSADKKLVQSKKKETRNTWWQKKIKQWKNTRSVFAELEKHLLVTSCLPILSISSHKSKRQCWQCAVIWRKKLSQVHIVMIKGSPKKPTDSWLCWNSSPLLPAVSPMQKDWLTQTCIAGSSVCHPGSSGINHSWQKSDSWLIHHDCQQLTLSRALATSASYWLAS